MTPPAHRPRPRRADATRNADRIVDAAIKCLARHPSASMADIATEAGLGRVTLYGHFSSRTELIDAVVARVIERGEQTLGAIDLDGDTRDALLRLVQGSWQLIEESQAVVAAAQSELPPARLRDLHEEPAERVRLLIDRGRRDGRFRTDMPTSWLVAMLHQTLHGAATEIANGHLAPERAPDLISETVLSLFEPVTRR